MPSPSTHSHRAIAVDFMEGVRGGWSLGELAGWCVRANHALGGGAGALRFEEEDAGALWLSAEGVVERGSTRVGVVARVRVLDALTRLQRSPPDDGFLQGAISRGEVRRVRPSGAKSRAWAPVLPASTPGGIPLSSLVLSLFAADMLRARADYETNLRVCRSCGSVAFDAEESGARACPLHAPVTTSRRQRASTSPPSATAVVGRNSQTTRRVDSDPDPAPVLSLPFRGNGSK